MFDEAPAFFAKIHRKAGEYKDKVQKEHTDQPSYLDALRNFEIQSAKEDEIEISDEELENTMKTHKTASPFAMDRAGALAQLLEAIRE
tara:strand:- start:330 stop:593 length:264 start_codon:yes stop_codon:yes gene_type:complete